MLLPLHYTPHSQRAAACLQPADEAELHARQRAALARWSNDSEGDRDRERLALRHWRWIAGQHGFAQRIEPTVLLVHSQRWLAAAVQHGLHDSDWTVHDVHGTAFAGVAAAIATQPDALVLSEDVAGRDSAALLARLARLCPDMCLVLHLSHDKAFEGDASRSDACAAADVVLDSGIRSQDLLAALEALREPAHLDAVS